MATISSLLTVGAFQFGSLLLSTSSTLDHPGRGVAVLMKLMRRSTPRQTALTSRTFLVPPEPYRRGMFIGSGPSSSTHIVEAKQYGDSWKVSAFHERCYVCPHLSFLHIADSRGILLWVPVGVFFTRHVYSFASITGSSMQVIQLRLDSSTQSLQHSQRSTRT